VHLWQQLAVDPFFEAKYPHAAIKMATLRAITSTMRGMKVVAWGRLELPYEKMIRLFSYPHATYIYIYIKHLQQ